MTYRNLLDLISMLIATVQEIYTQVQINDFNWSFFPLKHIKYGYEINGTASRLKKVPSIKLCYCYCIISHHVWL